MPAAAPATGIGIKRVWHRILAVLESTWACRLPVSDCYLAVAGGLDVEEGRAADLGVGGGGGHQLSRSDALRRHRSGGRNWAGAGSLRP